MYGGFLYDIYDFQAEKLLRKKFMPKYIAQQIFDTGMYDSHAIIRAVDFPSNQRSFERFLDTIIEIKEGGTTPFIENEGKSTSLEEDVL